MQCQYVTQVWLLNYIFLISFDTFRLRLDQSSYLCYILTLHIYEMPFLQNKFREYNIIQLSAYITCFATILSDPFWSTWKLVDSAPKSRPLILTIFCCRILFFITTTTTPSAKLPTNGGIHSTQGLDQWSFAKFWFVITVRWKWIEFQLYNRY